MYIPDFNRVEDRADILAFIRANPFAILVSNTEHGPFATHLPILVRENGDQMVLHGHMARANPHWTLLENDAESLVIFHGPHAYISPSLYEARENVPTWNYAAVHVYGQVRVATEQEHLLNELRELIHAFEPAYYAQWEGLPEKYRYGLLKHIVGFELTASRVEAKFKLSQNRSKADQASVITALAQSSDSDVREISQMMQEQGLGH